MPTTNKPAPVATGTDPGLYNPVTGPVGPLDTAPAPVPAGPGLGTVTVTPDIPVVTTAQAEIATSTSSFVPSTITPNTVIRYLSVSDEGVAINSQVTNINFEGTGVSVANNANAINSVVVTIGGATYGNSNVVTLLAGFGSNVLSTTGNVTGGNLITTGTVNAATHTGTLVSVTGNITGGNITTAGIGSFTGSYMVVPTNSTNAIEASVTTVGAMYYNTSNAVMRIRGAFSWTNV
jgi:hypothetical protein